MENETAVQQIKISDMIRETSANSNVFMQQIAEHIDKLELTVLELQKRVSELEKGTSTDE
jgi:alkyl hydroperoxide reductase subunit AhpF